MDLTWKGGAKVFRLSANIYLKLLFLAKLLKYFTTDLLELIRNRRGWYKFWLQRYWANKHLYCWSFPLLLRHESWSKSCERRKCGLVDFVMHQSIPDPPPPPGLLQGICLVSPGGGAFANFALPGAGHLPTPEQFPSFWHARGFLSEYNYIDTLLAESLRSYLDKPGKRNRLFPTYLLHRKFYWKKRRLAHKGQE